MEVGDLHVGKQLQVVSNLPGGVPGPPNVAHGVGAAAIPGAAWFDGSLHVGAPLFAPGETEVGFCRPPTTNALAFANSIKSIFAISGRGGSNGATDVVVGDPIGPVGISVNATLINIISPITSGTGILNWSGAKTLTGVVAETGAEARAGAEVVSAKTCDNGSKVICGNLDVAGTINVPEIVAAYGVFSSVAAPFKQFDIPHPNKKGMRLRHACIEGPEVGVYYRGKLKDTTKIELPEYWRELVDAESITVNLTPHGCYQELFVKSIEWGTRITIQNNSGGPIDCSYVIYGKRKDVPDLEVEYEGNEIGGKK
jgi:hypothetical protein